MRGRIGSGCRECSRSAGRVGIWANMVVGCRKIFPPTEEELAARRSDEAADEDPVNVEEAGGRENARPDESQANNLKMDSEDIDKNWEAVEKPSAASSEKTTDISEEGEKIEAANLAEEEGVEVEKPVEKGVSEDWKLENKLVKDW